MQNTVECVSESAARAARDLQVVMGRLRRRLREMADTRELTPSQISVLTRLRNAGAASASDLAASEGVRPQSVASTLAALDERGLIERRPDPDDGRRQLVSLSQAGLEMFEDGRRATEEWLTGALHNRYTEAERQTVIDAMALLERLIHP